MICYKDPWRDPLIGSAPDRTTGRWADWPLFRPESDTTALKFVDWDVTLSRRSGAWIVGDTSHPLYAGTDFSTGDRVDGIAGDEWDALDLSSRLEPPVTVLGQSELLTGVNTGPSVGHTVVFSTPSGGFVFASGTLNWSWGLDNSTIPDRETRPHPGTQQLTRNVFDAAIGGVTW
jgi:hypothetical protein